MRKKIFIIIYLLLFLLPFIFAGVRITEVSGQVEVRVSGSAEWQAASVDMEITMESVISTGFRSRAVLDLGTSQIEVLPLSRMSVSELSESSDLVKTSVLLNAGRIRADVKTAATRTHEFRVTSPVATASVRGTSFQFDGFSLKVFSGTVLFFNLQGERAAVSAGAVSRTTGTSVPTPPAEEVVKETEVSASTVVTEEETVTLESAEEQIQVAEPFELSVTIQ